MKLGAAVDPSFIAGLDDLADAALYEGAQASMVYAKQVEAYLSNQSSTVAVPGVTPPLYYLEARPHLNEVRMILVEWMSRLAETAKSYGSQRRAFEAITLASSLPSIPQPKDTIGQLASVITPEHAAISAQLVASETGALRDAVAGLQARLASAQGAIAAPIEEPISTATIGLAAGLVAIVLWAIS